MGPHLTPTDRAAAERHSSRAYRCGAADDVRDAAAANGLGARAVLAHPSARRHSHGQCAAGSGQKGIASKTLSYFWPTPHAPSQKGIASKTVSYFGPTPHAPSPSAF